jgi:multicomponent Na+:H+ antiporter subunit D
MVFLGPTPSKFQDVKEAPGFLLVPMIILAALCIVFGILPSLGLKMVKPAWQTLYDHVPYITEVLGGAI